MPASGGRVPFVAGGWGRNPTPLTASGAPATMSEVCASETAGAGAKATSVNVSNSACFAPLPAKVRTPKRAPAGASAGRSATSVVEKVPSDATATAPAAVPPMAVTSAASTTHLVWSAVRPSAVHVAPV